MGTRTDNFKNVRSRSRIQKPKVTAIIKGTFIWSDFFMRSDTKISIL